MELRASTSTPKPQLPDAAKLVRTKRGTGRLASPHGRDTLSLKGVPTSEAAAQRAAIEAMATGTQAPSGLGSLWGSIKDAAGDAWDTVKGLPGEVKDAIVGLPTTFEETVLGVSHEQFKTLREEGDPGDVNAPDDDEVQSARRALSANAPAEARALERLSAGDRQAYAQIKSELDGTGDEAVLARRSLQKMLLDGRLPGKKDAKGQGSVLKNLQAMAGARVAPAIDRAALLAETTSEIENPVRINQHARNTCGAATAQILLARKNPAEYVRVIGGLASPEGKVQLAGGDTIARVSDWQAEDGGRSIPSRLLQPPLMTIGQLLPGEKYDNTHDNGELGGVTVPGSKGLFAWGEGRINSQLQGRHYEATVLKAWDRDAKWEEIKQALADGKGPIPTGIYYNTDGSGFGHYVQVDRIENGRVYFTNPWGKQQSLAEDEYKAHVYDCEIPE